jgi:hypothetical protein
MNRIWDNYNNKGYDVADSFIFGLHSATGYDSDVVPLCITTGGWFTSSTPLYDLTFTNAANPSGAYYHIQYLSSFDTTAPPWMVIEEIPRWIERIHLIKPDPPIKKCELVRRGELLESSKLVDERGPMVRVNTLSNALYLRKPRQSDEAQDVVLSKEEYADYALSALAEEGLLEEDMVEPLVSRMMIQLVPREGPSKAVEKFQKSVIVTFGRTVDVGGQKIPVLGEGSKMSVQLSNDAQVMNITKVWRKIKPRTSDERAYAKVKPLDMALREAWAELGKADGYVLVDKRFGYKAKAGNVRQYTLGAIYQFVFKSKDGDDERCPPRAIEIVATLD